MSNDIVSEVRNAPPGTFKLYKGNDIGHDPDSINTHLANLSDIGDKIQNAINSKFYIEAISLRIQIIDFWLRVYFRNTRKEGEKRQREFGRLLEQCKKLGLDANLFKRLSDFNDHRVKAIHGYVMGKITYNELDKTIIESKILSSETIVWILQNAGETLSDIEGRSFEVGDMILNWKAQIAQLKSKKGI